MKIEAMDGTTIELKGVDKNLEPQITAEMERLKANVKDAELKSATLSLANIVLSNQLKALQEATQARLEAGFKRSMLSTRVDAKTLDNLSDAGVCATYDRLVYEDAEAAALVEAEKVKAQHSKAAMDACSYFTNQTQH